MILILEVCSHYQGNMRIHAFYIISNRAFPLTDYIGQTWGAAGGLVPGQIFFVMQEIQSTDY